MVMAREPNSGRATPKSSTLTAPPLHREMLPGFMSRWMTPRRGAAEAAPLPGPPAPREDVAGFDVGVDAAGGGGGAERRGSAAPHRQRLAARRRRARQPLAEVLAVEPLHRQVQRRPVAVGDV